MARDGLTKVFDGILLVGTLLNYACGVFFLAVLIASFFVENRIGAHLVAKYGGALDWMAVITTMRVMMLGGLIGVAVVAFLFAALRAVLASIATGEPFASVNAAHLRTIGWMLFALQLLDLIGGAFTWRLKAIGVHVLDWSPSFTGWLAVLVAFVLARVFTAGAEMQDDLRATI